jgi:hypothetical protein
MLGFVALQTFVLSCQKEKLGKPGRIVISVYADRYNGDWSKVDSTILSLHYHDFTSEELQRFKDMVGKDKVLYPLNSDCPHIIQRVDVYEESIGDCPIDRLNSALVQVRKE